jgi:hypothetical protein
MILRHLHGTDTKSNVEREKKGNELTTGSSQTSNDLRRESPQGAMLKKISYGLMRKSRGQLDSHEVLPNKQSMTMTAPFGQSSPIGHVVRQEVVRRKLGRVYKGDPFAAPVLGQSDHDWQVACVEGDEQVALVLAPLHKSMQTSIRSVQL